LAPITTGECSHAAFNLIISRYFTALGFTDLHLDASEKELMKREMGQSQG
jgi:hypothetical protein